MDAPPRIWTIGHGTRSIDAFLALLHRSGTRRLVDVRTAPGSRRNPQYGQEALRRSLADAGIAYAWGGRELGGFRRPREDSRHTALVKEPFRGYADHMDTPGFREALARLLSTSSQAPSAIMCAEAPWWLCHRRMIADALTAQGCDVVHILDDGEVPHELHPNARIEGDRPVYDVGRHTRLV
jgi:uncharacterized protein (DUF488 family)